MKLGDYVIINETGRIGVVVGLSGLMVDVSLALSAVSSEFLHLEHQDVTLRSEFDEIKAYPNNFAFQRYGICSSCLSTVKATVSTNKSKVECDRCPPGWCELYPTEVERDIRFVELKHNVKLLDIYKKENRKSD